VLCPLGFDLAQCVEDHWCRPLNGGRIGVHWRARCPVCLRDGHFEISITGTGRNARLKWNCHTQPKCDHDRIRAMLPGVVVCQSAARGRYPEALVREIGKLICSGMDPSEMRLRIGQAIWPELSASAVAEELGLSRATRYRLRCPPSVGH
jgi:hypothetical protein